MSGWASDKGEPDIGEILRGEDGWEQLAPGTFVRPIEPTTLERLAIANASKPEPDPDTYLGKLGYEPVHSAKPRKISPRVRLS